MMERVNIQRMKRDESHPPTTEHNHLRKIMALVKAGKVKGVSDVTVAHDDWCDVYTGGFCNCEPDVKPWPKAQH